MTPQPNHLLIMALAHADVSRSVVDYIFRGSVPPEVLDGLQTMAFFGHKLRKAEKLREPDGGQEGLSARELEPLLRRAEIRFMEARTRLETVHNIPACLDAPRREIYALLCQPFESEWLQIPELHEADGGDGWRRED